MTRIVAGRWKGRRLAVPRTGVRPTSDRVREAIFNTLRQFTGDLTGQAVLDLYAGSGALGLEALSRGAARLVAVEADRAAAAVIRENLAALDAPEARVEVRRAGSLTRTAPPGEAFDLVLADPPYDVPAQRVAALLHDLLGAGRIRPGAVLVVETARRTAESPWPGEVEPLTQRDYGDTRVWYGRARTSADDHDDEE